MNLNLKRKRVKNKMGLMNYVRKVVKAFTDPDRYYSELKLEDEKDLREAENIRQQGAREAYLKATEGQEELRKERVEKLKLSLGSIAYEGDVEKTSKNLEKLMETAKEGEVSEDFVQDCIYSSGKQAAANAYDKKGINPDNIAQIVEEVAQAYKSLLGRELDKQDYVMYVNKTLIENLLEILRNMPKGTSITDAENAVEQAKELLKFTDDSEEKISIRKTNLNRLLGANYLKHIEKLAKSGSIEQFEHYKDKFFETLKCTENTPEEFFNLRLSVDKYRVMCHKGSYINTVAAFGKGGIPLAELEQCVADNNKAVRESLMPEMLKPKYIILLSPNAYRAEIDRLIYCMKFIENKSQFKRLSKEIRRCIKPSRLNDEERASLEDTLSRVNKIFKRVKKPVLNVKINPNFKKQVKAKLENIENMLKEIPQEEACVKMHNHDKNSSAYKDLRTMLNSAVVNNGHKRPPAKKDIIHVISRAECCLLDPGYREQLYLDEVWLLQLKVSDLKDGAIFKKKENGRSENGKHKNSDKSRFFDRRIPSFTKRNR